MNTIFIGQTSLRIRIICDIDISDATKFEIKYKKPTGIIASWDATVESENPGIVYYDLATEDEINEIGVWTVWPYFEFSDGRCAAGSAAEINVFEEGES